MKKKTNFANRIIAMLCTLALLFTNIPATAFASEINNADNTVSSENENNQTSETPTTNVTPTAIIEESDAAKTATVGETNVSPAPTDEGNNDAPAQTEETDSTTISIVKADETVAENLVVGKSDAKTLSLKVKVEGTEPSSIAWTAADGTADGNTPAAKAGAVTLANAGTETVTITSNAGWQGGLVNVTVSVAYTLNEQEKTKSVTVPVTVWTDWGVSVSVKTSSGDIKDGQAEMTNTLVASFAANEGADTSEAELAKNAFTCLWEKKSDEANEAGEYTYEVKARASSFKPEETGVYRFTAECAEDAENMRNEFSTYTTEVNMVKIPVVLSWEEMSREYDNTNYFDYTGKYTLKRFDNPEVTVVGDADNPGKMEIKLTDSEIANVGTYLIENVTPEEGSELYNTLDTNYVIQEVSPLQLTVRACKLNVVVTVPAKNYDGTDKVEGEISVEGLIENASLVTGEDDHVLTAEDLTFSSKGSSEENTTVQVVGPESISVAVDGEVTGNYEASITYNDAEIRANSFIAKTFELQNIKFVGGFYWVKTAPMNVKVKAAENYRVASSDGDVNAFGESTTVELVSGENNSLSGYAYVMDQNGDIGKATIEKVQLDQVKPSVEETGKTENHGWFKVSSTDVTYELSDDQSGIDTTSVYYLVTSSETAPTFNSDYDWIEAQNSVTEDENGKYYLKVTVNGKLNDTIYVRVVDNAGNETINSGLFFITEETAPEKPQLSDSIEESKVTKTVSVRVSDANIEGQSADEIKASGIERVSYALYKGDDDVTPTEGISIANVLVQFSKLKPGSGSVVRDSAPKTKEDIVDCGSMAFDLVIDGKTAKLEGTYTLKVTAYDYCDNSSTSEMKLVFDGVAPRVSVTMEGGNEVDGTWYYKADNCGITVTFEDLNIADGDVGIYRAAIRKKGSGTEYKDAVISKTTGTVEFSKKEVTDLGDCICEVIFEAVDAAGNSAGEFSECTGIKGDTDSNNEACAWFVLDMTAPAVKKVSTNKAGNIHTVGDEQYVYYNESFATTLTVEDGSIDGVSTFDPTQWTSYDNVSYDTDTDNKVDVSFNVEADGIYAPFSLIGTDYAGNYITIDKTCTWAATETDTEKGVAAVYGTVLDTKPTNVTISYFKQDDDNNNIALDKEYVRDKTAYYNGTIAAVFEFRNCEMEDLETTSIECLQHNSDGTDTSETLYTAEQLARTLGETIDENGIVYTLTALLDDDGTYQFVIRGGEDRSGSALSLAEDDPSHEGDAEEVEKDNKEQTYTAAYTLVKDTESPRLVSLTITPGENAANKNLNEDYGNRYYFNDDFTVTAVIEGDHLGDDKIFFKRAVDQSGDNSQTVMFGKISDFTDVEIGKPDGNKVTLTETVSKDGVYAYAIYGTDLAGNPIVYEDSVDRDSLLSFTGEKIVSVSGNSVTSAEAALISRYVVVDTGKPTGMLTITVPKDKEDGNGNVTTVEEIAYKRATGAKNPEYSMPYQLSDKAVIAFETDTTERTPVKLTLSYADNGNDKLESSNAGYEYQGTVNAEITEAKTFYVRKSYIKDLAGNESEAVFSRRIYLDKEPQGTEDKIAPVVNITPVINDNVYKNQGRPVYEGEAEFEITVTEPYSSADGTAEENRLSSGLKSVTWQLKEKTAETEIVLKEEKNLYTFTPDNNENADETEGYEDEKLTYEYVGNITVPANEVTNRNDLRIVLTVKDNAGNERVTLYDFGIDITEPTVTVTFDNNNVKGDKYFKAPRTATITVTERNFDPAAVKVEISAKDWEGSAVSYTDSGWGDRVQNTDTPNGDADTFVRTITFENDGEYKLNVRTANENGVDYVYDIAGNKAAVVYDAENTVAATDFVIDQEAPTVTVSMDDTEVVAYTDGNYYYRADNCGFVVSFDDHGHKITVPDGSPAQFTAELLGGIKKSYPSDKTGDGVELIFTNEEVAKMGDGPHNITVAAVDAAGNAATALVDISSGCVFEGLTGTFILDATSPTITGISTTTANANTSGRLYADTNSVYYSDSVTVVLNVKEQYAAADDFSGISIRTAAGSDAEETYNADIEAAEGGFTYKFTMEPNNHYGELVLTGRDWAGNPLILDKSYNRSGSGNDDLSADGKGTVISLHGKTIDNTNPTAVISYHSNDYANMYGTEAYYNKDIKAAIGFADNFELDPYSAGETSEALVGAVQTYSSDGTAVLLKNTTDLEFVRGNEGKEYGIGELSLENEGHYTFTLKGTDRATNPIIVTEMKPWTDSVREDVKEPEVTGETFNTKYELVLDKTAPTFRLSVSSPSSVNRDLNADQGNRYYFNSGYTATVQVSDVNFDAERITVRRGAVTSGLYDSSSVGISTYNVTVPNVKSEDNGTATYNYTDEVTADGVYRYAIYGSDKAGNALIVPAGSYNLDGTDENVVNVSAEIGRGSLETIADTSNHIVIDTVKPTGSVSITNPSNAEYYLMRTNGNVEKAEPYRDETSAKVNLSVDEKVERTPVRMNYTVTALPSSASQKGSSNTYAYNNAMTVPVSGRQQFKLTDYTITDLAGNTTTAASRNFIYLDREEPSQDRLAPVTAIKATAPANVRSGNGQDLYNGDVTLSVKVTDPYGGQSSSGLADIYYEVYINRAKVEADTTTLHGPNEEYRANNYDDPALDYVHEQTITIPAATHNYNDVKVAVTSYDNAGNMSTSEYSFGIDITSPTIRVQYDNNDVQNAKYFKADRVATVTVTERNFNEAAMSIVTQAAAGISGWTHNAGGAANGDDDTWVCTVAYRTDGNYTFSVSGADLLGWQAGTPEYIGAAAQDFVLDKTAPALSVSFDNNEAANEKYYKADRTATLTVSDVNFQGTNDIAVLASGGGSAPGVSFGGMSASLPFTADGVYSFSGTVTDMAGNVSNVINESEFVIDKTMPEIELTGVEDLSANAEALTLTLTMTDVNMNEDSISVVLNGTNRGEVNAEGNRSKGTNGVQYVFNVTEDDYYRMEYTATDLAGNSVTKSISFSENQNGTVFEFLGNVQENGYSLERFTPEYILTNVDEVTILSVTLNGQEVPYTYANDHLTFNSELPSDGKYVITVDVTDAAGNMRSDRQEFIVDTQAPKLTVMGLSDDGLYFEEFVITLRRESQSDEFLEIWMDGKELTEGEGEGHYTVAENGDVYIAVTEYAAHELYVKVRDEAGNVTMWPEQEERVFAQILAKNSTAARIVTGETRAYEFRLTNSILLRWYSNKPVFFISLAAIAALLVIFFLILKRRKDEEDEKKAKQA